MSSTELDMVMAVHRLFKAVKLLDLGQWSEKLKGLGALDLGVLHHAARNSNALLGDIRRILDVPHSTLTSAINRLERKGLIRRVINPQDRRSYGLLLTKAGHEIEAEHMRMDEFIGEKVFQALENERDRAEFVRLLEKVAVEFG